MVPGRYQNNDTPLLRIMPTRKRSPHWYRCSALRHHRRLWEETRRVAFIEVFEKSKQHYWLLRKDIRSNPTPLVFALAFSLKFLFISNSHWHSFQYRLNSSFGSNYFYICVIFYPFNIFFMPDTDHYRYFFNTK